MSRLDELKNGTPINQQDNIDIDMTAGIDGIDHTKENRVSMGNARPQPKQQIRRKVSADDLSRQMAPKKEVLELDEKDYVTSVEDPDAVANQILNGENSLFGKWKAEKINEYNERMAQFDEEREELIDEGVLDPKDIKDPDFDNGVVDDEGDEEEVEDENYRSSDNNAELVLDNDDLFNDEEDYDEVDGEEEPLVPAIDVFKSDNGPVYKEDPVKEEKKVEEKKSTVHITEEDREFFDTIGGDVDSSRFIKEDDDEEEESTDDNKKESNDDVLDDEEEDDDSSTDTEETLKHLKELITERLQPTFKKLDINQFKIVTKKSSTNIKPITDGQQLKVVKWVLPNQKQCVFMKQFTGLELQTLSENIQEGSTTAMNIAYRMIYDHIVSNKPKKFTDWLAVTPDSDIDHYMFCVFVASYKGTNYLPMTCTNDRCTDPTFLTDDLAIMDMVKFKDDDAKNKFSSIYKSEIVYSNAAGYYVTATTPVSNKIAISFKESTLKDIIDIESLDERFRNQYRTTIGLIPYIDNIYEIDMESQSLIQINFKEYDNPIKTLRTKIRKYAKLIDTLTPDEFGVISAIIQDISQREDMISYVIPEIECPACGTKIPETATTATQLVFTRYQLGALTNTSLN